MRLYRRLRWPLLAGAIGCGAAVVLIVIWYQTNGWWLITWIMSNVNWLSDKIAYQVTARVFHSDRISYGWITNARLYELLYVLLTGLQVAIIAACIEWVANRKRRRST